MKTSNIEVSVVVPLLNEESLFEELSSRIIQNLEKITNQYEIIFVDDGSTDDTWIKIQNLTIVNKSVKGIRFIRNFGHHFAITAGLTESSGNFVVVMDGDLQDRPEVISQLFDEIKKGYDVVFVARTNRTGNKFYLFFQRVFYWLISVLSGLNFDSRQANFSIISREVVEAYKHFSEKTRFYVSTLKWLGFKESTIEANHGLRKSGKPSYTFKKRINLALDTIISFSERPLRIAIIMGTIITFSSLFVSIVILYKALNKEFTVLGWPSLILSIYFMSGVILIVQGIIGVYVGKIYVEVKNRPIYIIKEKMNLEQNV